MKKTAVEFLVEKMENLYYVNFEKSFLEEIEQAKEIEKEQQGYSEEELLTFGKSCFYKGFEKSEKDDANCYTAFREEIAGLIEQFKNK